MIPIPIRELAELAGCDLKFARRQLMMELQRARSSKAFIGDGFGELL